MEIEKLPLSEFTIDNKFDRKGGEAIVSKALHPRFDQVAIKRWMKDAHNSNNEIELLVKNCNHQNIIQSLGILMDESNYIGYIMPYMSNGSLEDGQIVFGSLILLVIHDKSRHYGQEQIKSWIIQISYGLSYLPGRKIIHRDMKPSNVLLGESLDDVKLSDFGIAKSVEHVTQTMTTGLGTGLYMAPEIFKCEKNYDFSADVYSLSITFWEILHRKIPYGHITIQFDLLTKISKGARPKLNNNLSKEVSALLKRCWDADASKRPTIDYVREFCSKTTFSLIDLENSMNEDEASLKHLNVHNNESSSKIITANKVQSANVYNKRTVEPRKASNDDERPPIPPRVTSLGSPFLDPIEQNSGGSSYGWYIVDSIVLLENSGQNWKELNIKLPYAVQAYGAQFLNNNLYIFGGWNAENKQLNCTYKLSKSLHWQKMADMNQKRRDISNSSVILNNQIWVCGDQDKKYRLKSVEMYDPETNKWKYMKEMNECRQNAAAAVVNGKIFCCGGWNLKNCLNSVECYDPSSDIWTLICTMPEGRRGHSAIEMNENFITMGGRCKKEWFNNVWALDTMDKNTEWIEMPFMSIPRSGFSVAQVHDQIFVCGGEYKESVEIFDGKVWRNGPMMPNYRSHAPTVVIPVEFARHLE